MNIGDYIKIRRLLHRYSPSKMASIIGVSTSMIWCWENRKKMPSLRNCMILCRFFGVSIDEMVELKNSCHVDVLDKLRIIRDDGNIDVERVEVINTVVDAVLLYRNRSIVE